MTRVRVRKQNEWEVKADDSWVFHYIPSSATTSSKEGQAAKQQCSEQIM